MLRKMTFIILAGIALIISSTLVAFGQVGELRGHVLMAQADGTTAPAADAAIDVFRVDLSGKYNTKTNKKGEFVFAGLPLVGTYIVAASHPSARPTFLDNVKVGREVDYELKLSPGDGKRLTLDEIKAGGKQGGGGAASPAKSGRESESDKAKREEAARQAAEIEAKNKKIEESNTTVARTFEAGNAALTAKNYDEAIKLYDEGLVADPNQPALLTNKALAAKARGVTRYNAAIAVKEDAAKTAGLEEAKKDFRMAAEDTKKAIDLLNAQTVPTDPQLLAKYNANKFATLSTRAEAMRLFVTKVDPTQADAASAAFAEYIAAETDPVKKAKAQMESAQMLLDAGAVDKAFNEFHTIVAAQPDNPDANLGAGLALFASGDKAKYQDAANYLQHFVDAAPDSHKFKDDAKAILAELKNTEKVVPEKTAPATRRKRP